MSRGPAASPLPALAVLDWGIGGFGLVSRLVAAAPRASYVYLSDSGFTPYGRVPPRELAARLTAIAHQLARGGVRHLVIACNAASTVVSALQLGELRVNDVISHGLRLAASARGRRVGVIGGERTIRSGLYRRGLIAAGKLPLQRVAQPLSARVEIGDLASPELDAELRAILRPLYGVDALLLACTHYPAIAARIASHVPGATLLDPVDSLLPEVLVRVPRGSSPVVLTTGDRAATRRAACLAFGHDPGAVRSWRWLP